MGPRKEDLRGTRGWKVCCRVSVVWSNGRARASRSIVKENMSFAFRKTEKGVGIVE